MSIDFFKKTPVQCSAAGRKSALLVLFYAALVFAGLLALAIARSNMEFIYIFNDSSALIDSANPFIRAYGYLLTALLWLTPVVVPPGLLFGFIFWRFSLELHLTAEKHNCLLLRLRSGTCLRDESAEIERLKKEVFCWQLWRGAAVSFFFAYVIFMFWVYFVGCRG